LLTFHESVEFWWHNICTSTIFCYRKSFLWQSSTSCCLLKCYGVILNKLPSDGQVNLARKRAFFLSLFPSRSAKLWILEIYCSRLSLTCIVLFHEVSSITHVGCFIWKCLITLSYSWFAFTGFRESSHGKSTFGTKRCNECLFKIRSSYRLILTQHWNLESHVFGDSVRDGTYLSGSIVGERRLYYLLSFVQDCSDFQLVPLMLQLNHLSCPPTWPLFSIWCYIHMTYKYRINSTRCCVFGFPLLFSSQHGN
jgi:hypothetical protein